MYIFIILKKYNFLKILIYTYIYKLFIKKNFIFKKKLYIYIEFTFMFYC